MGQCYVKAMFTSTAGVFRKRQAVSDLTSFISSAGRTAFGRLSSVEDSDDLLDCILIIQDGRFSEATDAAVVGEVLLASALPDEDFPAFTCATALLLLNLLQSGTGGDDLRWNWDAFAEHYRLADPGIRAVLMNAFRIGAETGALRLSAMPEPQDCMTYSPEVLFSMLVRSGHEELASDLLREPNAREAGELWAASASKKLDRVALAGFRFLFERPTSMAPSNPAVVPPIPLKL